MADRYRNIVLYGDALRELQRIPSDSVHCCVTSPPYWKLRDYRIEGQLGWERTPSEYVDKLVAVLQEVRRVLHPSGTLWLNLGDTLSKRKCEGVKVKDLVGIPWKVAFALRDAGWWLRSDVIWNKGNAMPESVKDRPTRCHEYLFLLTKSRQYFYDLVAVQESGISSDEPRNRRSVWTINPKPYPKAHFAVFPPTLPETCIKAGTSEKGACARCGAPWERHMVAVGKRSARPVSHGIAPENRAGGKRAKAPKGSGGGNVLSAVPREQRGWKSTCSCGEDSTPCVVMDPFAGSGTTLAAAARLKRYFIGIELNPSYEILINERLRQIEEDR